MYLLSKSFTFNGVSLPDAYALASPESIDFSRDTAISRNSNYGDITPYRSSPHYYSSTYAQVLKFDIFLVKCDGKTFSTQEREDLISWLDSPREHCLFTVVDKPGIDYHQGLEYFTMSTGYSEWQIGYEVYGLLFHFECNAPYAFTSEYSYNFDTSSTLVIDNTSHESSEDIYPVIEIKATTNTTAIIKNINYPDDNMELKMVSGQTLTIDCQKGLIEDNMDLFDYSTDTNLNWLHLSPGRNSIVVTGSGVTGMIKCRYVRKMGI